MERKAGILLPVYSLPNKYGIGTFGESAYQFIDFLKNSNVKCWQVLPMHPLTYGNSPYQSTSTFAGNIYLIDLDLLVKQKLIEKKDFEKLDFGDNENKVDYEKVVANKKQILRKAAKAFIKEKIDDKEYNQFKNEYDYFLDEYVIFTLLKDRYAGVEYSKWDRIHRLHYDEVIKEFYVQNQFELEIYKVIQFFFFKQWLDLKKYANEKNIEIIGDMPIYSSLDSVEVFSDHKNFYLDEDRKPIEVAGCPPDAFSKTGQLWRNPLYDYEYMKKNNYNYFVKRISHLHKLYDVLRIDHFRGFASYYSIPANEETALNGKWKIGPGKEFFDIIKKEVPTLKIIAEDLGLIDDYVRDLLKYTEYPGMKVVEFAFGGDCENHPYLPKNYNENSVAYLGTHDNDTFKGWFNKISDFEKKQAIEYLHLGDGKNIIWQDGFQYDAIKELFNSKSYLTIILMQDLLGLGTETRINTPSTVSDENWSYRFSDNYLKNDSGKILKNIIKDSSR